MDTIGIIVIVAVAVVLIAILIGYILIKKRKSTNKDKTKKVKEKKVKQKKEKIKTPKENPIDYEMKGSYVDVVNKFLYRKEMKLLVLVSRALPKGYIAFPKIAVDKILEPVGNRMLYNSIIGKYIDIVVFDNETMKPKLAIDIYDGTIGDEQIDIETPEVILALKSAELPLVTIKVKTDYDDDDIKNPIYRALGIVDEEKDIKESEKSEEE